MSDTDRDGSLTRGGFARSPRIRVTGLAVLAIIAGACAPGATVAPSASPAPSTAVASPATSASSATPASASPAESAAAAAPTCGTAPVVLNAYFETGFDLPFKLSEEFTKEYPNVTWNISQDQFATVSYT